MIRFAIYPDKKVIELLSGGSLEELKDLADKFKGYSFTLAQKEVQSKGALVGGAYIVPIPGIEHN